METMYDLLYIEPPLAEEHILDEPIPGAVKKRLIKPLAPRKYRPVPMPRKSLERKRKAAEKEFDPIPRQKSFRSLQEYQDEVLGLFAKKDAETGEPALRQAPRALRGHLRGWLMEGRGADPRAFLEQAEPTLYKKLVEELEALNGVKFQLRS